MTLTAPLAKAHAAAAAVTTYAQFRSVAVNIDTRLPTATFPAQVVNNRIGHGAANVNVTRVDPTPGSGNAAVRETWLDGQWVYPLPLDASKLSLGKHTWTLLMTDSAGNGNKVTLTFLVTTSIADLDALLAKFGTATTIPAATVTALRAAGRPGQDRQRRRRQGRRDQCDRGLPPARWGRWPTPRPATRSSADALRRDPPAARDRRRARARPTSV